MCISPPSSDRKLALLIDADNVSADMIEPLLAEVAHYGNARVKRIYGDWSSTKLEKWKQKLLPHAITPVQQFAYTSGKNATDIALVIDAMDLLHSGTFDGFCIVSSDSDFTRLASRIRENGLSVYGFGEEKAPEAFRQACDMFVVLENTPDSSDASNGASFSSLKPEDQKILKELVYGVIDKARKDDGWAELGHVGNLIKNAQPEFSHTRYGYPRLSALVCDVPGIESRTGDAPSEVFVRHQGWRRFIKLVQEIIDNRADNEGMALLSTVCCVIGQQDPDFDVRSLGHRKMPDAVRGIHGTWVELRTINDKELVRVAQRME